MGAGDMKHTLFLTKHPLRLVEGWNGSQQHINSFALLVFTWNVPWFRTDIITFPKAEPELLWVQSFSQSTQNSGIPTPKLTQARALC